MIVVFGSINIDLVARVASIPRPGETVLSPGYEMLFGGKGANQAVAAARALQGTGIEVAMVGRVGDDEFGRAAVGNLQANGVAVGCVAAAREPTGCAFIAVDERGENAITVASGANMALRAGDLAHRPGRGDVLVLQMEVPFAEALSAAREASAAGAVVIWNLAPAPASFSREDLSALLDATTILVVNEHEASAAAGALGEAASDAAAAAAAVSLCHDRTVILTSGAAGARVYAGGTCSFHAPAPAVEVVDTTGAGDTFVGVLAAMSAEGMDLPRSVELACRAASLACGRSGAQAGMPSRAELGAMTMPA
ncbi:ribokinase [Enterovirga aerilata]|uniref:Ribokinase n=1 Tax=Enterovirga aerilata TaxID=2730920 RepID=A0A849I4T9_9HYPH|nr:ribokinase [Enterovirga sp. DB1703]NNM71345.1 ribokinase [Enterovirga sp. DB1703]